MDRREFPEVRPRIDRCQWPSRAAGAVARHRRTRLVRHYADQVKEAFRANPYAVNVHDNWTEDPGAARRAGPEKLRVLASPASSAQRRPDHSLYHIGTTAEHRNIAWWRASPGRAQPARGFEGRYMPTVTPAVPFSQFGTAQAVFEDGVIWRRNRQPAITIEPRCGRQAAPDVSNMISTPWRRCAPACRRLRHRHRRRAGANKLANDSIKPDAVMAVITLLLLMLQCSTSAAPCGPADLALGIIGAACPGADPGAVRFPSPARRDALAA